MNQLSKWLRDNGVSQTAFADSVGITQAAVSQIASDRRAPGRGVAFAIEKETGGVVLASSWPPKRRKTRRRRRVESSKAAS